MHSVEGVQFAGRGRILCSRLTSPQYGYPSYMASSEIIPPTFREAHAVGFWQDGSMVQGTVTFYSAFCILLVFNTGCFRGVGGG